MRVILDYNSPQALKIILEARGMAMQKKFGQNFLINSTARKKLVDALEMHAGTTVWEVGPGLGCMTAEMLERGAQVSAFEIDRGFCSVLREMFTKDFTLIEGDVLKKWQLQTEVAGVPERFFGNLPYNIAATLICDTISAGTRFDRAVVTIQKEVAQRMCAKPASEHYSSFSVLCQWAYDVSPLLDLSASSFWPRPHVESRAVLLRKKADFPACSDSALFMKLLRASFSSRRKTLKNNLTAFFSDAVRADSLLKASGLAVNIRAERLSTADFLRLTDLAIDVFKV